MKKSVLALAMAFGVTSAFAQDLTSKKGEPILPEADDWAVSIDATPFLDFAGKLLSTTGASAPNWNHLNANNTIIGKMFKDEKTAYRGILRIGLNSASQTTKVLDPTATAPTFPALPTYKEDKYKMSSKFIGLGAGIEMRRGKTRLQGYYGADAMLWFAGSKDKYTYGNALNPTGTTPVTVANSTNFGSNITTDTYNNAARITEKKSGTTFGLGIRGFLGAEYFIFPKISVGGEFGWGIGFSTTGKSKTITESINNTNTGTQEVEGSKSGGFSIDTDRNKFGTGGAIGASGALRLNLHF